MSRRKLTDIQVARIRTLHDQGWSNLRIGNEFGVLPQTVQDIVTGKTYTVPNASARNCCVKPRVEAMRMVREFKLPPLPRPLATHDIHAGRSYPFPKKAS